MENDNHNPQNTQPRSLFDLDAGDDNLFHGDRCRLIVRVTVINGANKEALYNFLSTFRGMHYVTLRTVTGELGFHCQVGDCDTRCPHRASLRVVPTSLTESAIQMSHGQCT